MTKIFSDREFQGFQDGLFCRTFADIEFHRCNFIGCAISATLNLRWRSRVSNVKLIQCEQLGSSVYTAIVEDVLVDGCKTNGLFNTCGAVFKHVVIKGKVGQLMISPLVSFSRKISQQRALDRANMSYYASVDWALDIREAQFEEAVLCGVPARLVLRDPETQFVLRREKALEGKWKSMLSGTYWDGYIDYFLERGAEDEVMVAPKLSSQFRKSLDVLLALRDAGVVE